MEVLLMCWPAGARSLVHCHDESSCWVSLVEGQVHEVQYDAPPGMDGDFFARAMHDPDGAVGRCGPLRVSSVAALGAPGEPTGTYANNELGLHAIENRSARDAITLHVYAPRLRRMKVFRDAGADGSIASVASVGTFMSEMGEVTGRWRADTDPDGLIDVTAWNRPCTP
jgi:cysteine dioxygenase